MTLLDNPGFFEHNYEEGLTNYYIAEGLTNYYIAGGAEPNTYAPIGIMTYVIGGRYTNKLCGRI